MKASWLLLRVGGGPLVVAVLMAFPPPLRCWNSDRGDLETLTREPLSPMDNRVCRLFHLDLLFNIK